MSSWMIPVDLEKVLASVAQFRVFEDPSGDGIGEVHFADSMLGAAKPLTEDLVLLRSKADSLAGVKHLNLWGNDLCDVS